MWYLFTTVHYFWGLLLVVFSYVKIGIVFSMYLCGCPDDKSTPDTDTKTSFYITDLDYLDNSDSSWEWLNI